MGKKLYFSDLTTAKRRVDPDTIIALQIDFVASEGRVVVIWDDVVNGLRIRVGKRVASWQYYHEQMEHGHRFIKCDTLGHFERGAFSIGALKQGNEPRLYRSPAHMSTADARRAAEILRGKILEGAAPVGKRTGLTVADAMNGYVKPGSGEREIGYLTYLETKAKEAGKPSRWAEKVRSLYKVLFEPSINGRVPMASRTLQELSDDPSIAEDWHRDCKQESGPTSANRASQVLRAMYSRTARRGGKKLGLSKVDLPTASVEMHREKKIQKGLDPENLSVWYKQWQVIPSPVKRAYHMICLLTGARRGELCRVQWDYLSEDRKAFTLLRTKTENDIIVPVTPQIAAAIALARDALTRTDADGKPIPPGGTDLMFPGCFNNPSRDGVAYGHALRRTYKTIATGWCHVPDDISAVLLGHAPEGMSPKYRLRWTQQNWPAAIEAQHKISTEIERLLHAN